MSEGSGPTVGTVHSRLDRLPITRTHRRAVAFISLVLIFELYEIYLAGIAATILTKQFHMHSGLLKYLLASVFFGMFVGAVTIGRIADKWGRRDTIIMGVAFYSLFALLGALSTGPWMLIGTRFLAGLGIGAVPPLVDTYLSDLLPAKKRGHYLAIALTVGYLGIPIAGFLGRWMLPLHPLGLPGWRWMFLIGACGAVVAYVLRATATESPRWLESVGRHQEAERIVEQLEAEARRAGIALAEPVAASSPVAGARTHLRDLFRPPYGRRFGIMAVFHVLQPFAAYGFGTLVPLILLSKGYDTTEALLYTALSYLGAPAGSALSLLFVERVERKHQLVLAGFGMALFGIGFASASSPAAIIFFGVGYTMATYILSNAFHIYQAEIFPTRLRATASSWVYSLSRLSSGAMPFILVPLLDDHGASTLLTIIAVCIVVAVLTVGVFGPQSNGRVVGALVEPDSSVAPNTPNTPVALISTARNEDAAGVQPGNAMLPNR